MKKGQKRGQRKTVQENLLKLVQVHPTVVNDYNALISLYWVYFDDVKSLCNIVEATPAETITRNFRTLVASGKIKVPECVRRQRQERELDYRHEFAHIS